MVIKNWENRQQSCFYQGRKRASNRAKSWSGQKKEEGWPNNINNCTRFPKEEKQWSTKNAISSRKRNEYECSERLFGGQLKGHNSNNCLRFPKEKVKPLAKSQHWDGPRKSKRCYHWTTSRHCWTCFQRKLGRDQRWYSPTAQGTRESNFDYRSGISKKISRQRSIRKWTRPSRWVCSSQF